MIDHKKLKWVLHLEKELDTLCSVPQGSILCPLLFDIDIMIFFYCYEF